MKPLLSQLEYQQIELIIPEQPASKQPGLWLKTWFIQRLQAVGRSLSQHSKQELQVWYTPDQQGNVWWSAYDPETQRSVNRLSHAQMLIWIEQRYYTFK